MRLFLPLAVGLVMFAGCGGGSDSASVETASVTETTTTTTVDETETESSTSSRTFTNEDWSIVVSDPESYKGSKVELVGRVFSVERDTEGVYLQAWADSENSEQNTIVAYRDPDFQVKSEDYVRVVGEVQGEYEGKNAFGANLTVPVVVADSLKVVDATAAAPKPIKTLKSNSAQGNGIVVTVTKVEFADSETRVFVKVRNGSRADLSIYGNSAKAVSGSRAYQATFSARGYPDLQGDLPTGTNTSGVIVFPKMNPNAPLRLIFEGYSDDSNIGKYGSVKYELAWKANGQPV